jgi:hypothetical protein
MIVSMVLNFDQRYAKNEFLLTLLRSHPSRSSAFNELRGSPSTRDRLAFSDAFVFEADFCQGFCIGDVLFIEQDGWFLHVTVNFLPVVVFKLASPNLVLFLSVRLAIKTNYNKMQLTAGLRGHIAHNFNKFTVFEFCIEFEPFITYT